MTLALERKTRADLAARSPVLAKLHATLIGIRNAHAYPARMAIDAYFDAAALRARARMGHLTWQLGDATAGTIAFDAATLMPASEETALAGVLVPIAMAIAEDTWTAINASGASQRPVRVKSSATRSFKLATNALNFEVKASPNTIDTGDPAWDAQRPSVQSIAAGAQSRAVNITDTTRAALAQTISTGADRGYSIQQIANGVPDDGYAGVHAIIDETYKNRSLAIAQYELGTAQNRASTAQYSASGLETVEVMDDEGENSCDVCIEIDGQIWPIDVADSDPLEHPWCFSGETMVVAPNVTAAFRRWFDGEVVVLRTAANDLLTCTPNHPILTPAGWVPAGSLREGSHVFRAADPEAVGRLLQPDNDQVPTRIEDIARAFLENPRGRRRAAVPTGRDFHGDGAGSQVYEVATASLGELHGDAKRLQQRSELPVEVTDVGLLPLLRDRAFDQLGLGHDTAAGGGMSGRSAAHALFGADADLVQTERLGLASHGEPGALETAADLAGADTALGFEGVGSLAGHVALVQFQQAIGAEFARQGAISRQPLQASGDEPPAQPFGNDPTFCGEIGNTLARLIAPVQVEHVERREFHGFVYTLETAQGWFIANHVTSENCVRAFVPHFPEDEPDDEQPETEEPPSGPDVEAVAASTPAPAEVPAPIDDGAVLPNSNLLESAEPSVASPMLSDADWAAMTDAERDAWSDMTPEERVDWLATFHAAPPPTVANADWQAMTEDEQTAFLHANPHAVIEPPPDAGDYGMTADSYGADIGKIPANVAALGDGSPPPHPGYWDDLSAAQQAEWTDAEDQATQDFMDTHAAPGDLGFARPDIPTPAVLGDRVQPYEPSDEELDAAADASADWEHGLTDEQEQSLKTWFAGSTSDVRYVQMRGSENDLSRLFDSAIADAPRYEGTVYRGASALSPTELEELTTPGTTMTLRADSSTSKDPTTAFLAMDSSPADDHVYYVIDQTGGADVESLSSFGEHEVVIQRGTTYHVDSVEQIAAADNADFTNKPFTLVHLTEVPTPPETKRFVNVEQKAAHPNAPVNTRLARFVGDGLEEWQITKPAL